MSRRLLIGFLFLAGAMRAAEPAKPMITVVAFGDSTTAGEPGIPTYAQLVSTRLTTRLGTDVKVINAGVRGNTTNDAAKRFATDVLAVRPAAVVIQFGINDATIDVWKKPPATAPRVTLAEYRANLERFVHDAQTQGVRVVLMTSNPLDWTPRLVELYGHPPYDPADPEGLNVNLVRYAAAMRELATKLNVPLVDVMDAHARVRRGTHEALLTDGMHPNQRGQEIVADLLTPVLTRELTAHP